MHHTGVDGVPLAPLKRTATMPNMAALKAPPLFSRPEPALPEAPPLPTELAKTQRAPSTTAQTVRATPASGQEAVRNESPTSGRAGDREAILEGELAKVREELAAAKAHARGVAEAQQQTYPPKVEPQRRPSPAPASAPASVPPTRGDWAKLRFKVATAIVAALVLVIAALAYWAVAAIDAKRQAIADAQEAKKKADGREEQWRSWASVVIWIEDCRDGRDVRSGEMLLPDLNKQGSARKLEPWQNPCSPKLPPPP